jgi:hypothetical protein
MTGERFAVHVDVVRAITSEEADEVTPLMAKIYYRLLLAPDEWWQSDKVLRVKSDSHGKVLTTAWTVLVNWLRVTPEDARLAIEWLNEKEIINYQSDKDGREISISFEGVYYPKIDS